ncbi:hypothetical protein BRAS3809_840002 [Bradyrhizobium sp. STM 3809]|nr:hypothetical protein BRAS3809_840002 [Bradyrhizobium sp. STM 3809]
MTHSIRGSSYWLCLLKEMAVVKRFLIIVNSYRR